MKLTPSTLINNSSSSIYIGKLKEDYNFVFNYPPIKLSSHKKYCFVQSTNQKNKNEFFAIYSEFGSPNISTYDFDNCMGILLNPNEIEFDLVRFDDPQIAIEYLTEQNNQRE